jgi:hypothetical protein
VKSTGSHATETVQVPSAVTRKLPGACGFGLGVAVGAGVGVGLGLGVPRAVGEPRTIMRSTAIAAIWAVNDEICRLALLFFASSSMLNIGDFLSAVWFGRGPKATVPVIAIHSCTVRNPAICYAENADEL